MKAVYKIAYLAFAVSLYVGCSKVKFSLDESKCEKIGQNCVVQNGFYHFDNTVSVGGGKVDILIVDDNSASMSFEQKNLAARFTGFVSQLESNSADYRIGIITTDVSSNVSDTANNPPRAINGNGALQDGNLIPFNSSTPYLTPTSAATLSDRVALFNNTIVRPETAKCEQFIANWISANGISSINSSDYSNQYIANCPSGDERGVFAANLAIKKNSGGLIRSDAHLAVIFLSDEDERSGLYTSGNDFLLSSDDQPATLIKNITNTYSDSKNVSIHSITVKDSACLDVQNNQTLGSPAVAATTGLVKGSMGTLYQTFATNGWGQSIDICFNDYTSQLSSISTDIVEHINSAQLACSNTQNLQVVILGSDNSVSWTQVGKEVRFSKVLPAGTQVKLSYDCSSI